MSFLDPTPWDDFVHKLYKIFIYPPKWFFGYFLRKWWVYTKLLWNDIDFEYEYILPLLALKTKHIREYLLWENVTYVDLKKMREVELLCNRIFRDEYLVEDYIELESRYNVSEIIDKWFEDPNNRDPPSTAYYNERRIISTRCERIKRCDEERLFHLLSKNLHKWWS